ncbi:MULTISPECIES: bifunctional sugar-1-phosphate nucleotidylyltransferase/acetyltransferase [Methanococcoides]|jgi:glucose-1-phosphate thymidylyltransferase|uniref:Bifunctional protein GlmU n=1 Tax=Methanococcoides seepicolus TaxID=2828780 RepID=A0A9E4ZHT1_9EURY|nr:MULTISPECIES: bifunctional sugar-1-phosphate nucleotidylyltransferase/acetyltransferase [Methanococcoides]MCM1987109.1 NTP transferase domain-containing protein [Methanococcoides seepicolus]
MKAVILAAGEGLRCRPLTLTRSKVMLPVANKPIIEHVIDSLAENGIKDLIIVVGYERERIMDYFEDGIDFGINITYVHQKAQLGTAHAIKQVAELMEEEDETILVLNGDNVIETKTIKDLLENYNGNATILTARKEHTRGYGVIVCDGKKVKKIIEKPTFEISHVVNTGIYMFGQDIFERIEQTPISQMGEYAITDTLQQMIDDGIQVDYVITDSLWRDAVFSWDILKDNSMVLDRYKDHEIKGTVEEGAIIRGNVSIGNNTIIRSGCYIVGPALIGDNCEIAPTVVILPSTTIGDNVTISSFSHIQNSIIMNNTRIGNHSHIANSVIGMNNSIGPYFITEDKENLKIEMEEEIQTVNKLGTITGDDNIIGHRVLVKAGAMISSNCNIDSGKIISRNLPENSIVV